MYGMTYIQTNKETWLIKAHLNH